MPGGEQLSRNGISQNLKAVSTARKRSLAQAHHVPGFPDMDLWRGKGGHRRAPDFWIPEPDGPIGTDVLEEQPE